jgi:hypothetical protein
MENIIPAINVYIVNEDGKLLVLKEKGNDVWLALSGAIKDGDPEQVLKDKAVKELNLKINQAILFDTGPVGNILMNRYLTTDYSGEIELKNKYEDFKWINLEEVSKQEYICPHVKKASEKILKNYDKFKKGNLQTL